MPAPKLEDVVVTDVSYLRHDEKYDNEKLYTVNYDTGTLFPRSNVSNELKEIRIKNVPGEQDMQKYNEFGFSKISIPSDLQAGDYEIAEKVNQEFYPSVRQSLGQMFPEASKIEVLEHQIRKRHSAFPIATGERYETLLPTTLVHIDFTPDSAERSSHAAFNLSSGQYKRLLIVNLWKSLQGPGNDWPLALCDRRTVDYGADILPHDIVFDNRFNENARLYFRPEHEWYYFKDLQDDEIVVFQQFDSELEGGGGVPHTGFLNPQASEKAAPRVSIELRAFIYFT